MKTLLMGINAKYIHPNLAIRLLKANTTYDVDIIEFNIKDSCQKIIDYVCDNHYTVLGLSCYIWNIEIIKQILLQLKGKEITIILGGPEVSYNANYYLENDLCDYVIKNEGEESFQLLLDYLNGKHDLYSIPNLYYKGCFTFDKLVDIKSAKMAYNLLDDVENQIVYIETSRGCPFHCGYCMASLDNKLRFFDIELIMQEIIRLLDKGAKVFKFLDRTFNANKQNFLSLIDFIISNHKAENSFQFEITGDLLDEEVIDYINKRAPKDLFRFEIGIQSTNLHANLAVGRIQNNERLFRNIRLIQEVNIIDLHLDLIAGLPYEDYQSFQKTFNEVLALKPKELQLGFLKLLYGTQLHEQASSYNYHWQKNAPYELIDNQFMSANDIKNIHYCEASFDKYYNYGIYSRTMAYVLDSINDPYLFFYDLGRYIDDKKLLLLEDFFVTLDDFLSQRLPNNYNNLHKLLIIDYLNHFTIKPQAWWKERISPKEKNNLLRFYYEKGLLDYPLDTLYKYSLLIPLQNEYILAIYQANTLHLQLLAC